MIRMVTYEALTLDEAYRNAVDGLRELGWKDLALDSKKRGINASFEGKKDTWEILLKFGSLKSYEVRSRSSWKVPNETADLVQHLVEKINQNNPEHDYRMNDNGSFEVKTTTKIPEREQFMENIKKSMISNIQGYDSYAEMLMRFVNIEPEHLEYETDGFRALMNTKFQSEKNHKEDFLYINLEK